MSENQLQSPQHNTIRTVLRIAGPLVAGLGLVFMIIGFSSFFLSFGSFGTPRFFWCAFVGMPLLFVGFVLCKFGYMGDVYRYVAGEVAPVAKDTANYMGEGIQPGVKAVSKAVAAGILEAQKEQQSKE